MPDAVRQVIEERPGPAQEQQPAEPRKPEALSGRESIGISTLFNGSITCLEIITILPSEGSLSRSGRNGLVTKRFT